MYYAIQQCHGSLSFGCLSKDLLHLSDKHTELYQYHYITTAQCTNIHPHKA